MTTEPLDGDAAHRYRFRSGPETADWVLGDVGAVDVRTGPATG